MRKNSAPSFGLVLPSSAGDKVADEETLFSLAEAADSSPLEHLWVSDHIVWWHPMYESLTLLPPSQREPGGSDSVPRFFFWH